MTAYLFPGQGSQFVGMGRDLYDTFPSARSVFEEANQIVGFDLRGTMFGSGVEALRDAEDAALRKTDVTQPALFVHSLAAWKLLVGQGVAPAMVAGHSLGEYSALAASEAITFEDGLRIARLRGQLMAAAGDLEAGTMAALIGLDAATVDDLCQAAEEATGSVVRAANFNAPGQIVISGAVTAVTDAMRRAGDVGARKVIQLPVSGAFHSPLMGEALGGLTDALESLAIAAPSCPIYLNVSGLPTTDPAQIRAKLAEQLLSPVRWTSILQGMREAGADEFVEVGSGRVLSGLVRRTLGREVSVRSAGKAEDFGTES